MKRNVEIKAKIHDPDKIIQIARTLPDLTEDTILHQEDYFFKASHGRLKLRKIKDEEKSQLICYEREDSAGPRLSQYSIAHCSDSDNLLEVLKKSLGIIGEVKKTRHLLIVGQTRVHVDTVENLGTFMELEVVLTDDQTESDGEKIAHGFLKDFDIKDEDIITCAYMDLLLEKKL